MIVSNDDFRNDRRLYEIQQEQERLRRRLKRIKIFMAIGVIVALVVIVMGLTRGCAG